MTTTIRTIALAAALIAAAAGALSAQAGDNPGQILPEVDNPPTRQGTRGANFLEIGVGARENAMAGAVTSLVGGPTSWYWNPAGAAGVEGFTASASLGRLYEDLDITHAYIGIAVPIFGGVIGAQFNGLNSGDIERTTTANPFGDVQVGLTYEWSSMAAGLGYARRLTDRLDLGLGAKVVSEGVTDASTTWVAFDFGTQFRTGIYGLTLGASLQNIGPSARASGQAVNRSINTDRFNNQNTRVSLRTLETELPTLFRFSVGTDLIGGPTSVWGQGNGQHVLQGDLNVSDAIDTDIQAAIGLEYGFRNVAFLRVGKRFYNDERAQDEEATYGLAGGLGIRLPVGGRALNFDYAYTSVGELQNVQVFTFGLGR